MERYKSKRPAPAPKHPRAGKLLVRVTYIPDKVGYLVAEGPEQSEIRWKHNGNTFSICNEFIERIK